MKITCAFLLTVAPAFLAGCGAGGSTYTIGEYTGELLKDGKKVCYYEFAPDAKAIGRRMRGTKEIDMFAACPRTSAVY